jgi:hypothetical protein
MLRFDTAMVVTSNPFNVNRQAVSSHNREMLGDMCEALLRLNVRSRATGKTLS